MVSKKKNKNITPEDVMKFLLEANKPGSEYHLWDVNPSYRDFNMGITILRFVVAIALMYSFLSFLGNLDIPFYLFITCSLGMTLLFLYAFSAEWFSLRTLFRRLLNKEIIYRPFEDLVFWKVKSHDEMIFFSNKRELTHVGMGVFRTEILPENVSASFISVLSTLAGKAIRIPFTYQVIQVPRHSVLRDQTFQLLKEDEKSAKKTTLTRVLISIPVGLTGVVFTSSLLEDLTNELNRRLNIFKTLVFQYFHHYKLTLLEGDELVFSLRMFFLPVNLEESHEKQKNEMRNLTRFFTKFIEPILRSMFFVLFFFLWYLGLAFYGIEDWIIDISIVIFFIAILFTWWRRPLFLLTYPFLRNHPEIAVINPFHRIKFYQYHGYPDMLFIQFGSKKMVMRMMNLRNLLYPHYVNMSKFLRAIMGHGIRFSYTLINSPLSVKDISKELKKSSFLAKNPLLFQKHMKEYEKENYLSRHGGFYRSMLLLSVQIHIEKQYISKEDLEFINEEMEKQANILSTSFLTSSYSQNLRVEFLRSQKLVMGTAVQMLKTKMIRTFGTSLIYQVMQGTELQAFFDMPDELKKAVATKIGSEFLTPLDLENFITIGHAIDLEHHGKQVPAGFTEEQLDALLISHGTEEQRQALLMNIVKELVIRDRPCIIFDFHGDWSKLIRYFDQYQVQDGNGEYKNPFRDKFSYYAIGINFILNLFHSGIKNDPNNVHYLEYFYKSFCLTFKKSPANATYLRKIVEESLDREISANGIAMGNDTSYLQPNFFSRNDNSSGSILDLLDEIKNTRWLRFSESEGQVSEDLDFPLKEAVESKKTIIIDLSRLYFLRYRVFAMFMLFSRFLHYYHYHRPSIKKYFVLPNADYFFNKKFIENIFHDDYTTIDMFINPIKKARMGILCSVADISRVHSQFINYFSNFATFRLQNNENYSLVTHLMNIDTTHQRGLLSKTRHDSLQLSYLRVLPEDQVIIKRNDNDYPFPVEMEWKIIKEVNPLSVNELSKWFDIPSKMQQIRGSLKSTLFEKDLGKFKDFIPEIIQFFEAIKSMEQVGNLYEATLKAYLLEVMKEKAMNLPNMTNRRLQQLRDELFKILKEHQYLEEHFPPTAAGSQTIRPSFKIGEQYYKALDDYQSYKMESKTSTELHTNTSMSNELTLEKEKDTPEKEKIEQNFRDFERKLAESSGMLLYHLYKMSKYYKEGEYQKIISMGHESYRDFMSRARSFYLQYLGNIIGMNLEAFLNTFAKSIGTSRKKLDALNELLLRENGQFRQESLE
ncbi:MAG: hypothetical protein ACTSWE_06690, partial [Promethearchaeota archaeon]